jgi:hypothetical protein
MNKWWVIFLADGTYIQVQAEDKDEAKRLAWENFNIPWYNMVKFELYYK